MLQYDTEASNGRLVRKEVGFRICITEDGPAGSTGDGGLKAEAGRYHLYVSLACPWAHCAFIFRKPQGAWKI